MQGCRPLTEEEVDLVMKSFGGKFGTRDTALFTLGVLSGFRITELLSLRIKDVQQHGLLVDRVTVERKHMKRKVRSRTVLLHPQAKVAVQAWLEVMPRYGDITPDTYLFKSRKGENHPISRVQAFRILKRLR